ncbi:MAG: hypothetical protein JSU01_04170 [Bacteroidetes bacterium]|nr:hypothetical protein [Bacteroidota bacterium]
MKVEDNNALRFILQDEIYLLDEDKSSFGSTPDPRLETQTQQPEFNYLGSNKKSFLILVNYDTHEFMQDDHLLALESVLGRLGHTREDVAIFNLAKHNTDRDQVVAYFSPKTLVILGRNAMPDGIDVKLNSIEQVNGIKTLLTFGFDEMMTNVENKKAFWEQMKNL